MCNKNNEMFLESTSSISRKIPDTVGNVTESTFGNVTLLEPSRIVGISIFDADRSIPVILVCVLLRERS